MVKHDILNISMKNTLLIAYNGGAYGTYLEWVLNTVIGDGEIVDPLTEVGNSHGSKLGKFVPDINQLEYLKQNSKTARFHPKTKKTHKLKNNLESILEKFQRMVLIYPDRDQELLCVNNLMTKIWNTDIYQGPMVHCDPKDIYDNYPVQRNTPLDQLPTWIKREHLSFNLFESWRDQVEWYFPDSWNHDRCLVVSTKELLFEFIATIKKIMSFWGENTQRDIEEIIPYHTKMLSLQKHLGQDQLVQKIIDSLHGKTQNLSWNPLPIASEAWIQQHLRNNGIELKCHGLDIFPTDTKTLLELCVSTD